MFDVIIEVSKGSNLKYEISKETNLLRLDRVLHTSMFYPGNYGYFPQTLAGDGDPLDVLVLTDYVLQPGIVVECKIICVLLTEDEKGLDEKILAGVVSMPSNIFATTGTNVSILFIDKNSKDEVVLIDASKLGKKVKEGKNQKTILSIEEEKKIINNFSQKKNEENFSIKLDYEKIKNRKYSLSAAQYFDYKIEYKNISNDEFKTEIKKIKGEINTLFSESEDLEKEINKQLDKLTIKKK